MFQLCSDPNNKIYKYSLAYLNPGNICEDYLDEMFQLCHCDEHWRLYIWSKELFELWKTVAFLNYWIFKTYDQRLAIDTIQFGHGMIYIYILWKAWRIRNWAVYRFSQFFSDHTRDDAYDHKYYYDIKNLVKSHQWQ
mgnify:CR=1 FL=1